MMEACLRSHLFYLGGVDSSLADSFQWVAEILARREAEGRNAAWLGLEKAEEWPA